MSTEFYWVAVVTATIISAARLTRLATVDKFPPVKAVRVWYEDKTDGSDWQWLTLCGYCFSFWSTLVIVAWGLASGVYPGFDRIDASPLAADIWWIANGTFAMSYGAAVFMARDGSTGEDD